MPYWCGVVLSIAHVCDIVVGKLCAFSLSDLGMVVQGWQHLFIDTHKMGILIPVQVT